MITRTALFATLAALLALPVAATAKTTTPHRATAHARPAHHAAAHSTGRAARPAPRDAGSAAVDALNDQSLARARGTAQ